MNATILSALLNKPRQLKPTQTVVRALPIIADAWEDAALKNHDDINQEEDFLQKDRVAPIDHDDLQKSKDVLRPTLTTIRTTPIVAGDQQDLSPSNKTNLYKNVEHLQPDYGWSEAHGFRGQEIWELPVKTKHSDLEARPGYTTKPAHEYHDTPEVLNAKVELLMNMIKSSKNCLLYSGAGISTASGIGDYATRSATDGKNESESIVRPKIRSPYEAQPTYAHRALAVLHQENLIHYWIQQNHDGLPQKAGLPQYAINEIHGAWYDPSNPVVSMSGNLRADLFEQLLAWEKRADLTIALGTSMCGMNSDRVFTTVANKGRKAMLGVKQYASSIGGVIINRQQTQFDHLSCLRIFADINEVMSILLTKFGMIRHREMIETIMKSHAPSFYTPDTSMGLTDIPDVFLVPYDKSGKRVLAEEVGEGTLLLDLREGSRVRLTDGPYCGDEGIVLGKNREGHLRIQFFHLVGKTRRPFESVLGSWWLQSASRGDIPKIPVIPVE